MADHLAAQLRGRIWVLFAMDACDRAGLTPMPKDRFHRLIFLSNCLAQLFSATPPTQRILKYKRGPILPGYPVAYRSTDYVGKYQLIPSRASARQFRTMAYC